MTDESERSSPKGDSSGADGVVRAQFDWASTAPSAAVIKTLAVALNRAEMELGPLYESVDPDALDALIHSTEPATNRDTVIVSFVFAEQQVTVHGTGEVIVRTADR